MSGSICETAPNRWQVRVSAGRDPGTGRYRYVHRTVTGSKRTAQKAADQLAAEVHRGLRPAERGTVADLLEKWMLHLETLGRAATTMIRYRSAIDKRIVPALGWIEVTKLNASDLDAFYGSQFVTRDDPTRMESEVAGEFGDYRSLRCLTPADHLDWTKDAYLDANVFVDVGRRSSGDGLNY